MTTTNSDLKVEFSRKKKSFQQRKKIRSLLGFDCQARDIRWGKKKISAQNKGF